MKDSLTSPLSYSKKNAEFIYINTNRHGVISADSYEIIKSEKKGCKNVHAWTIIS